MGGTGSGVAMQPRVWGGDAARLLWARDGPSVPDGPKLSLPLRPPSRSQRRKRCRAGWVGVHSHAVSACGDREELETADATPPGPGWLGPMRRTK